MYLIAVSALFIIAQSSIIILHQNVTDIINRFYAVKQMDISSGFRYETALNCVNAVAIIIATVVAVIYVSFLIYFTRRQNNEKN